MFHNERWIGRRWLLLEAGCAGLRLRLGSCAGLAWLLWVLFSFIAAISKGNEKEKTRLLRDLGGGKQATMAEIAFFQSLFPRKLRSGFVL